MLKIKVLMNSAVEDIFAFKTCCGARSIDQNLEIHLTNQGREPVNVASRMEMTGADGVERVDCLMPYGVHRIAPHATHAFYCTMDPAKWASVHELAFFDDQGRRHSVLIDHQPQGDI